MAVVTIQETVKSTKNNNGKTEQGDVQRQNKHRLKITTLCPHETTDFRTEMPAGAQPEVKEEKGTMLLLWENTRRWVFS